MNKQEVEREMNDADMFGHSRLEEVPRTSCVYTAWASGVPGCLYVGKSSDLLQRLRSHFSGQRGGDQFCLYVYDRFVHQNRPDGLDTLEVNRLTARWVRENVYFRFVPVAEEEMSEHESWLRHQLKPVLNPPGERGGEGA